jgi:hypothetical protein
LQQTAQLLPLSQLLQACCSSSELFLRSLLFLDASAECSKEALQKAAIACAFFVAFPQEYASCVMQCFMPYMSAMQRSQVLSIHLGCLSGGQCLAGGAAAAAPAPVEAPLPEGWGAAKDAQGRTYFWHKSTKKVQWDRPNADTPIS